MNVLFLTLLSFDSLKDRNIYSDLLREFVKNGHHVCIISPIERRYKKDTHLIKENNAVILRLKIGNTQKTNIIEKGISTIMIESIFKQAIRRYFSNVHFDLILYSTPPITLVSAIEYVKKRDRAKTYLLLKDIFPQNALDIGLMSKKGVKGLLYRHFRKQEIRLYNISDNIGCMSQANVDYLLNHNRYISRDKVEICPNSIEVVDTSIDKDSRISIRKKYGIPLEKTVFVYGGNLGKPQDIPFVINCIKNCHDVKNAFFIIIGDGTDFKLIEALKNSRKYNNFKLMKTLPKNSFDRIVASCDVGLIFLDHRFTIPNFPSRLLSYMQSRLPVFACTDTTSDVGKVISEGHFGWWCESNDTYAFKKMIEKICKEQSDYGNNGFEFLRKNYDVSIAYRIIQDK